ncbi:hypothetical protein GCM10027569_87460 [Flindersiella endophytica]
MAPSGAIRDAAPGDFDPHVPFAITNSLLNAQRVHDNDCKGAPSLQRKLGFSMAHIAYLSFIAATVLCLAAGSSLAPGNSFSPASDSRPVGPEILAPGPVHAHCETEAPAPAAVRAVAAIPVLVGDRGQTCGAPDGLAGQMGGWS